MYICIFIDTSMQCSKSVSTFVTVTVTQVTYAVKEPCVKSHCGEESNKLTRFLHTMQSITKSRNPRKSAIVPKQLRRGTNVMLVASCS